MTGFLLILFPAGLVTHGVQEFNEADVIPVVIVYVWDINPLLEENATLGSILKALFGYNGPLSVTEELAYFTYFLAIFFGLRLSEQPVKEMIQPRV